MLINRKRFDAALLKFTDSEQQLAKKSGVALTTWLAAKTGKYNTRPATICRIAKALEVEPTELIITDFDDDDGAA